jgi:hypothetical protein
MSPLASKGGVGSVGGVGSAGNGRIFGWPQTLFAEE